MKTRLNALRSCALAVALAAGIGIASAQQVTISRDSKIHAEPAPSAAVVGELKQGATAEAVGRQGAWVNVKSSAGTGWVYSFNVTYATGPGAAAPQQTQKRATVSTLGVRGLEKEDLKNATFDGGQLDALDSFAADGDKPAPKGAAKKK